MRWLLLAFIPIAALAARGEDLDMSLQESVQKQIESFNQAWVPKSHDLRRLVIVIDPARSGQLADRRFDEMSLMAGEHLYHLVRIAGATPVLTRADDQPIPGSQSSVEAAIREQVACARAHLVIRIECCPSHKLPEATTSAGSALSIALSKDIATSTGAKTSPYGLVKGSATIVTFSAEAGATAVADRLAHRQWAEQMFHGIQTFVQASREAIEQLRRDAYPSGGENECHSVPLYPSATPEQKRHSFARSIWPEGPLPAERANWFSQLYAKLRLSNRTLIYFEPRVELKSGQVVVAGDTTDRQLTTGLLHALRVVGIEATDEMRLLPDEKTLGQKLFGACRATMARTFNQPAETAGPQTQVLYGEPLFLLDRRDGHYLAQASDGYWGWLREEAVQPMTREQFTAYNSGRIAVLLEDVTHNGTVLRRGTRLPVECSAEKTAEGTNGTSCKVLLPEGGTLALAEKQVRIVGDSDAATERVLGALKLLYTPYVFGARSPIGLDCSGMVAYLSELTSLSPARDASQQALAGRLVATRWNRDGIRAGDLIYFIDEGGKIFHTGVALNSTHFIHCSPPEVQISSLKPGDRLYVEHWDQEFFIAKRP